MFTRTIASLLLLSTAAQAASHGGPCPGTFNAGALFPGQTVKNFITDMGATCNGVADDTPAVTTWLTYAISQNPACVVLFIPPGSKCNLQGIAGGFSWNGTKGSAGPNCINVWAQGATFITTNGLYIGGQGFYEDTTHDAPIQQANVNDGTVTLVNSGDAAIFAVNDWIAVTGLGLQEIHGGTSYPPNFQFYEFKQITNIAGTVITLNAPLVNQYLTTWPSIQTEAAMNFSGPARIFKMQPNWNVQYNLYWGTVLSIGGGQDTLSGRNITACGTYFRTSDMNVTVAKNVTFLATTTPGWEVDKVIENITASGAEVLFNMVFQSPAPTNFIGTNVMEHGSFNGMPLNATFTGGYSRTGLAVGTISYGTTNSISMNGTAIPSAQLPLRAVLKSNLDPVYSSGTFTVPKAAAYYFNVIAWAVPGYKYGFADSGGTTNSSPLTKFKILSVVDNGTTISINTDLVGALPTPTCGAGACTTYQNYGALAITQVNKPAGTVDITGFQAPP